jgi:hypothetical protein
VKRWVVILWVLLFAVPARAQSIEAETLFNQGDALMKQGKYAQACDAFDASNRLEQRAGTLIRLGECRERTNELASAWSAYKDALTRAKDPKKKEIANGKVKELEPRLSSLTISVAKPSRIDGLVITKNGQSLESALWSVPVPVNGGTYTIVARAAGKDDWKTTITVGAEKDAKTVDVPVLKDATTAPASNPITAPTQDDDEQPAEGPSPSMFTTKRKIAVGLAAGAVAGIAVGIVFGRQSKAKQDDANALCPQPDSCAQADQANALIKDARSSAIRADIAFGIGGAAAIGAAVLWFTGAQSREATIAIVPGVSSLTVKGSF